MSKLGTVEIPGRIKAGLKHYERLEGARKTEKLIEDASKAYLKLITAAIEKDSAIQAELDTEKKPRRVKTLAEMVPVADPPAPKKVAVAS